MRKLLLVLALLALAAPAAAEKKMYRCGSQYQDRPCEGPKDAARPAAGPEAAKTAAAPSNARGEERKQIRCENYGRQVDEIKRMETGSSNPQLRENMSVQRKALEARMLSERC
jgi:hypothetical protein